MRRLSIILLIGLASQPILAFAAKRAYVPLEQRLSVEQFQATGLDRLSTEQLALLNRLLDSEQTELVEHARAQGEREAVAGKPLVRDREPVITRISGSIRGWSRGDVLRLENGQRWRVVQGDLFLRQPVDNPDVNIAPGNMGGWYLQLPGQNQRAKVERID
ncbi:hypothetical protein OK348_15535 [Flavobacterium sp. MXW15]|uniref:Secreted protein n=1 Tax=Xanthomonas chitinilytica TaxID=2989819 RepID=A0ABT3K0H4_9XANT|nr:hypothetical protein [Xanthomonas sp. H13-6]MCW4456200.1 hypothetical protein [Flavobacterium sp. MXW15]MCW4473915.1 hypothetical protein [Xanthomonas sp. H13-6]